MPFYCTILRSLAQSEKKIFIRFEIYNCNMISYTIDKVQHSNFNAKTAHSTMVHPQLNVFQMMNNNAT